MKLFLTFFTTCLLATAADKPRSDKDEIQGSWVLDDRSKKNGVPLPEELRKSLRITFSANKIVFRIGDETHEGTFELEPDKKPKRITVRHADARTKPSRGIYFFSKGLLVLYFAEPGKDGPTEVPKDGGKGEYLVLERIKS